MRLRVRIKNSKDCRTELSFPDLCVKYTNGFSPILKVAEGDEIPLSVCDDDDVRKSLLVGSLKGYLNNGWVEEIVENSILEISKPVPQFITEQMVLAPKVEPQIKKEEIKKESIPPKQILQEIKVADKKSNSTVVIDNSITDLSKVSSYENFCNLSHILKLKYIKESNNIDVLNEISSKTPSSQIKNNIALRLSTIKI